MNLKISAFEAKTHLSKLLAQVQEGETFTITKHDVPIALLTPLAPQKQEPSKVIQELLAFPKVTLGLSIKELKKEGQRE